MYARFSSMTEEELRAGAAFWQDSILADGREVELDPAELSWRFEEEYRLEALGGAQEWISWFDEQVRLWSLSGDPERFRCMRGVAIAQPVVVVEYQGKAYLWDGSHRTGASFADGKLTIPAIVGSFRPAGKGVPQGVSHGVD